MSTKGNYVGIDMGKDSMYVHVLPSEEENVFENTSDGHQALATYLHSITPELIVLEATGGLQAALALHLTEAGFTVAVVNPYHVRCFASSTSQLAKNDRLDARIIARFARDVRPTARKLSPQEQRNLAELARRRDDITRMLHGEQRRLEGATDLFCSKQLKKSINHLTKQLDAIDQELKSRIEQNEEWKQRYEKLTSVTSVGPRTATTLIALLPELGNASRREIAALAGTAPYARDSGRYRGQRRIRGGRPEVRRALFMAIISAVRFNERLSTFYNKLRARGMKTRIALVACMRKMLTWLNAMIRDDKEWKNAPLSA